MKISECKVGMVIGSTGNPYYTWKITKVNKRKKTVDCVAIGTDYLHINCEIDVLYEIKEQS